MRAGFRGGRRLSAQAIAHGRYTVERVLGRGGMAVVYLAHDRELGRPVALKALAEHLSHDHEFAERFRREAQTAARLTHPNIAQVFDTGEEDGRHFIVMEYVDGEALDSLIAREGALPPDRVVDLGTQACAALQYAHEHGVVHRDVKPGNLLLRQDGILKVVDFGIARAGEATRLTQVGTILGTLNYLAPEQARGEPVTPQADIYSLGAVLYELFTGEPPRRFERVAELATVGEEPVRPVRELAPGAPARAETAIMRALARHPSVRPASAAELAADLVGRVTTAAATVPLSGHAAPTEAATVPLRARGARRPLTRLVPALVVTLIVAVAIVAIVVATGDGDTGERVPVERVEPGNDALEQARNLERWLREHTAPSTGG